MESSFQLGLINVTQTKYRRRTSVASRCACLPPCFLMAFIIASTSFGNKYSHERTSSSLRWFRDLRLETVGSLFPFLPTFDESTVRSAKTQAYFNSLFCQQVYEHIVT
ncbi:hypothetical protein [Scytonema sp. NUACC21]